MSKINSFLVQNPLPIPMETVKTVKNGRKPGNSLKNTEKHQKWHFWHFLWGLDRGFGHCFSWILVVLDRLVFWPGHCNRKKPGELWLVWPWWVRVHAVGCGGVVGTRGYGGVRARCGLWWYTVVWVRARFPLHHPLYHTVRPTVPILAQSDPILAQF